ncbi:sigma 54-interacting transcriptional regulator [Vagococcus sp. DIV0080]|uniref:HTH-type transcriptional regulatory protein TyrR n=1 Tax=Candidatus Vagococcus giribetii TaxID=2230876 RepID=A0ABS3HPI5_9ENTE|nr:sigma 54-interacting transcriptional regulator [Vagococcus sp. DIV0080]MBO0475658.1 sigma 54-interacting transcriptional regulator [Vagococcus sp. DIV0080]
MTHSINEKTQLIVQSIAQVLEVMHTGLTITDGQGYLLYTGQGCEKIYGIKQEQITGRHITEFDKVFDPSLSMIAIQKKEKVSMIQPDQFGRELLVTAIPILDDIGEIAFVVSYASWDSSNIQELQQNYGQLQKQIALQQVEVKQMKNEMLPEAIIAESDTMKKVIDYIDHIKNMDLPLLITGDTGSGKNTITRYIHSISNRSDKPIAHISCSAFTDEILSDELFGNVTINKQTGEEIEKIGLCEVADTGILFVENIESMDAATQNKLLYVIKNKTFFKKNSRLIKEADFRIISTTRKSQKELMTILDRELYYLLSVLTINLPDLKDRTGDISILVHNYLEELNSKYHRKLTLAPETMNLLTAYSWPGNIQELRHVLLQLVINSEQDTIQPYHLPENISPFSPSHFSAQVDYKDYMDYYEKRLILNAYEKCKTTTEIAKYLGISQPTVVRKLQKYL